MRIIIAFFASLLLLLGIWAITLSIDHYRIIRTSISWPSVEGEVVLSQIREEIGGGPYGVYGTKKPEIRYEYTVDGKKYSSRKIKFGRQPSHEIVSRYPTGQKIKVFYNPDNPNQAVLISGGSLAGVYIGVILCIIAVAGWIFAVMGEERVRLLFSSIKGRVTF